MDAPYNWIESTSWELEFFGLPRRIPWPADIDPNKANEEPLDTDELIRGIEMLGPDAGDPWTSFRLASTNFDELAEALEDGEFPRAAQLLEEVERLHPGTSFVVFHKAIVARHDGLFEEAIQHYEQAAQKTPRIGVIWLHLGMLLAQEGDRDKAIAALNNAIRCNPEDTTALEALSGLRAAVKLLRDPKDPKSAVYVDLGTFQKMAAGQLQQMAGNHKGLMEFGEFQLRNNFAKDLGVQAFEQAAQLQPEDPHTLAALSSAYRMVDRHDDAKAVAQRLADLRSDEPQAWFNLAQICNAADDTAGERSAMEKMLALDKNAQPALAVLHGLNEGPDPEKEVQLAEYAKKNEAFMGYLLASSVARDRGDMEAAVRWAKKAYTLAPEREEVLLHYTAMLGDVKDRVDLVKHIQPAVLEGNFSKRLDWNFAHAMKQCGQTNEAVQILIHAASAENAPEDFKNAAASTIDFWTGRLAESGDAIALSKSNTIARPVVISLDGEDGAIVLKAGEQVPCEGQFPWRIRVVTPGETRITLQQGQSGSAHDPQPLGAFVVKVPPVSGSAHTIQCLIGVNPSGRLLFKAVQNNRELPVSWAAPQTA